MTALCLIHANCQGEVLRNILLSSQDFTKKFHIHLYTNYIREQIPEVDLQNAELFLYQNLGEHWGEFSSKQLLARINPHCQNIQIPNLFFKGYWPFWTNKIAAIDFANELLEKLLNLGLSTQDILKIYLPGNHPDFFRAKKIAMDSLQQEKIKEQDSPIHCANIIEEFWHNEQLFYTVNHPAKRLSLHVAQTILQLLDLPPLSPSFIQTFQHPDSNFILPIHPFVGTRLGLTFTGINVPYKIYSSQMTHKEFVIAYLACRLNNEKNIAAFCYNLKNNKIQYQ